MVVGHQLMTAPAHRTHRSLLRCRQLLLYGYGTKQQHLGPGETRTCPRCHNTAQWVRMRQFTQVTVFFVPVARWNRRRIESCGICGTSVEVG